jgi:valyl-tRNA synthetase
VNGHIWRLRYPIEGGAEDQAIVVATTRPETMLGDTAVAVNPSDERYAHLIGRHVRLPLADRLIPIIADEHADPEKGTGAVKITPAHDFNDFQVARRHGLPAINIFTPEARLNDEVPEAYRGLDRFAARKQIVADLDAQGLLDGIENHRLMLPYDEKSKLVVIEPYLTDQWYVDAAVLAKPALQAVEQGRTSVEPKSWEKVYFEWLKNIEPWCISRQLWWGHRIPAWYGPDGEVFVEESEQAAQAAARAHYGKDVALRQDEDVLDTWFSSALWPFSTLGWPDQTSDLKRFYPTSILITAGDIIFFWVARMMMMGLHFMGEVPFRRVFLNALVLDEKGQKMSKVKGNVIDPLELIDAYGADAVRFTMTAITGQTRHIRLSRQRVEGYRNFGTKLWNAARFCQMNRCRRDPGFDPAGAKLTINRWIISQAARTSRAVTSALEEPAFDAVAGGMYRFVWNVFCDWYLELAKPVLNSQDEAAKAETRATAAWVLDFALSLLHPVMPFITEELWAETGGEGTLMTALWPELGDGLYDPEAEVEIGLIIDTVAEGRSVRSELNVPPSAKPDLFVVEADDRQRQILEANSALISTTLRVGGVRFDAAPGGSIPYVVQGGVTAALPVADFIDLGAERARLGKEIGALSGDIDRTAKKLANPDFVARAPEEVVEENRERLAEAQAARSKLEAALQRLEAVG